MGVEAIAQHDTAEAAQHNKRRKIGMAQHIQQKQRHTERLSSAYRIAGKG